MTAQERSNEISYISAMLLNRDSDVDECIFQQVLVSYLVEDFNHVNWNMVTELTKRREG